MTAYVDWPDEREDPVGLAVILPGRNYPATMPLLTFAGRAAAQHGWRVHRAPARRRILHPARPFVPDAESFVNPGRSPPSRRP